MTDLERIGELFHGALERQPGPARDIWLEEAVEGDADLLGRVRSLLAAHAAAEAEENPLEVLEAGMVGGNAAELLRWARRESGVEGREGKAEFAGAPSPDDLVGRYRVLRALGHGGMGTVFLAHDPVLGRHVALKFLTPRPEGALRLLEEARAASALDHPSIGTVYEVGEDAEGRDFIAMAYYEGGTLRERLRDGALPMEEAVRIAVEVADALSAAHRVGIIHRDVKPENLVFDASGRVKVVDFGIARVEQGTGGSGSTGGTLAYMSPEQLDGREVDGRSDLWSLGVVLHEMLTGERPFSGGDRADVIEAIRSGKPPTSLEGHPPASDEIRKLLQELLSLDPDDRVPDGAELARRLRRVLRPSPGLREILSAPVGRTVAWGALGTLAIVFLAGAVLSRQAPRLLEARGSAAERFQAAGEIVVADFQAPDGLEELALATREALVIDLQQSGFVRVAGRARTAGILERMGLPGDVPIQGSVGLEVAERAGAGALVEVTVARAGARYLFGGRALDPATGEELFSARVSAGERRLLAGVERLSREMRRRLGEAGISLAESRPLPEVTTASLDALHLYAEAEREHDRDPRRASGLLAAAVEIDPGFAMAHRLAAVSANNVLDFAAARAHSQLAREHRDRLTDQERWHIEAVDASQAAFDPWLATDRYEQLLARFPTDARAHWNLGYIRFTWFGEWESAHRYKWRAVELDPEMELRPFMMTLALISLVLGQEEEALEIASRVAAQGFQDHVLRFHLVHAFMREDLGRVEEVCSHLFAQGRPSPLPVSDGEYCGSVYLGLAQAGMAAPVLQEAFREYAAARRFSNLALVGQALTAAHLLQGDSAAARANLEATVEALAPEEFSDPDRYLARIDLATQAALFGWPDLAQAIRLRYPPQPDPDHWFGQAGEALVGAALAVHAGDGERALSLLDGGFPPGVMPIRWRALDLILRGRAHELLGTRAEALDFYRQLGDRAAAIKHHQTTDRIYVPFAREGERRVAVGEAGGR